MEKLYGLLKSRKFWAAVIGVVLISLRAFVPNFPLTDDEISKVIFTLIAYILGTGLEDAGAFRQSLRE